MTKLEFLLALQKELEAVPREDMQQRLTFYSEMIEDRVEEGLSEEEAITQIGTVEEVAAQILAEYPAECLPRESECGKRRLKTWQIVLIILGSPVWASVLIGAASVVVSLYISLWAAVISLWSIFVSVSACGAAFPVMGVFFLCTGHTHSGIAMLGAGLVLIGLAIFCYFGCKWASKGTAAIGKKAYLALKRCFTKKEGAQ